MRGADVGAGKSMGEATMTEREIICLIFGGGFGAILALGIASMWLIAR
jgi:hypothetical protein